MDRHYANYFIFNISFNLHILYISVVLQIGIQKLHLKYQVNYLMLLSDRINMLKFPTLSLFLQQNLSTIYRLKLYWNSTPMLLDPWA